MATAITERTLEIDGIEVFLRERAGSGSPAVFVHGNPTSSSDWIPFLERIEGRGIAFDLPGFGRSSRPDPARFGHTLGAYATFVERLLQRIAPDRYRLVVHDWGALALASAARDPERVERLCVINAVPLNARYRWHWLARIWRRPGLGEAANALNTRVATAQLLRSARPGGRPMPRELVDGVWRSWDAGMRRAILGLYRSADPRELGDAGSRLGELRCPALVVWGADDPYIDADQGRWYAATLRAELLQLEQAGHWPWLDRPEVVARVAAFLDAKS